MQAEIGRPVLESETNLWRNGWRWIFPDGRGVFERDGGTFHHQPPNDNWECRNHASVHECVGCWCAQLAVIEMQCGLSTSAVHLIQKEDE